MPEVIFDIPIERLEKFKSEPIKKEEEEEEKKTPEEIEAEKVIADKAEEERIAAGGAPVKSPEEEVIDLSLLEDADTTLVNGLEDILKKDEADLTPEETKQLEDNEDLVRAIVNKDITIIDQLSGTENFVQEGTFEDSLEGIQSYLVERDKTRDKNVVTDFLESYPEVNALYEHTIVGKKPLITFLAQQNKPAILDSKIEAITESMTDDQKANITTVHEAIVTANLKASGIDDVTIAATIEGAKTKGTLKPLADSSLVSMNKNFNDQLAAVDKVATEKADSAKLAVDAEIEKVKTMIRGGKLIDTVGVSKTDEGNFIKYMSIPINEKGETLADKKYNELTLAQRTAIDYFVYTNFKLPIRMKGSVADKFRVANKANSQRKVVSVKSSTSERAGMMKGFDREAIAKNLGYIH